MSIANQNPSDASAKARWQKLINIGAVIAVVIGLCLIVEKNYPVSTERQLINVSYDPTRELYQALNPLFVASYEKATGQHWTLVQVHGGSSRQARKVVEGAQHADVVTLGVYSDVEGLSKRGLIAANWADRLPNHSLPYTSTIVFVVRKGNPLNIKDWSDLLAPHVEIVVPDPRTSGNGKLAALADWAATLARGGSEEQARLDLKEFYRHTTVLAEGARGAAIAFAQQETGDVHLTWENEAIREVAESNGKLQIVYPPISILAEPYVAWVDSSLEKKVKLEAAKAYLTFLFSEPAQEVIARLGYRPINPDAARNAGITFPDIKLVSITAIASGWDDANQKFFAENGIIDTVIGAQQQ